MPVVWLIVLTLVTWAVIMVLSIATHRTRPRRYQVTVRIRFTLPEGEATSVLAGPGTDRWTMQDICNAVQRMDNTRYPRFDNHLQRQSWSEIEKPRYTVDEV